ncbi:hypothetical protein [Agrobacterium pusense]|uniref:hypothetical protein n=1 Tax=Agrobacterium pusense TaxID=648995 RepID=UPI0022B937B8|nr:hypothetical protein [Agrobacterium pusense]MCZ7929575.1 hypothetical protein [Agrobacterium pusense]
MSGYVHMYGARQIGPAPVSDISTTTFGPLDKYVAANDNEPPRIGDFIQIWPDRKFYPFDPRPEDLTIEAIAHGLSNICRYSGAVEENYSVAEHSVLIARWLVIRHGAEVALAGLLHDAPEALSGFGDVGRPVKGSAPIIGQTEDNIYRLAVAPKFGLAATIPDVVHEADTRITADEVDANLAPMEWHTKYNKPLGVQIRLWSPHRAKQEFLATFDALMAGRAA